MTSFFIRLYQFFRSHQLVCWASMGVLFIVFGWFATRIHLEEDIDKLMPSSKNEDGTTKLAFADLKIKDKTFLLLRVKELSSCRKSVTSLWILSCCVTLLVIP